MLRIRLVGELRLDLDERRLEPVTGRRARSLLAWLAYHPGLHARARVASVFWPDVLESSSRASLRTTLATLRHARVVMAGAGLDALMIADADGGVKDRLGRLGYIWTGLKNLRTRPFGATITIEGTRWFTGTATCVLIGNVGELFGGVELFEGSRADDGLLEVGVLTATGVLQTVRTVARIAVGSLDDAAFARTTKAASVRIEMDRKVLYEVDGGERTKVRSLRVDVEPSAILVCVNGPAQR